MGPPTWGSQVHRWCIDLGGFDPSSELGHDLQA